jgi:hypothetical protein
MTTFKGLVSSFKRKVMLLQSYVMSLNDQVNILGLFAILLCLYVSLHRDKMISFNDEMN